MCQPARCADSPAIRSADIGACEESGRSHDSAGPDGQVRHLLKHGLDSEEPARQSITILF